MTDRSNDASILYDRFATVLRWSSKTVSSLRYYFYVSSRLPAEFLSWQYVQSLSSATGCENYCEYSCFRYQPGNIMHRERHREREHRYESNVLVYENRCASVSTGCQLSDRNVGWTCHVTYSFTFGDNTRSTNIREIRSHTHAHSTHTKILDTDTKLTYKRQAR
jgi:hypothetical protein